MPHWLDPVRSALDTLAAPVTIFVRDDDAGWASDRLDRLLDVTECHGVPIDLAAIPTAVDRDLAVRLRRVMMHSHGRVSVHQHGFAHLNHEVVGRKSEFGVSRSPEAQRQDLQAGRLRLEDHLGQSLPGLFTPPWNRCTRVTAELLVQLGYLTLSRDVDAGAFAIDGLGELPVHLDWTGRRGLSLGPAAWGLQVANVLASARTAVGLMLHHAVMSDDDWRLLDELLTLTRAHPRSQFCAMSQIATTTCQRVETVN